MGPLVAGLIRRRTFLLHFGRGYIYYPTGHISRREGHSEGFSFYRWGESVDISDRGGLGICIAAILLLGALAPISASGALIDFTDQDDLSSQTGPMERGGNDGSTYDSSVGITGWPANIEVTFSGFELNSDFAFPDDPSGEGKVLYGVADLGSGQPASIDIDGGLVTIPSFYVYNAEQISEPYTGSFRVEGYRNEQLVLDYEYGDAFDDWTQVPFFAIDATTPQFPYGGASVEVDQLRFYQFDFIYLDSITILAAQGPTTFEAPLPEPGTAMLAVVAVALGFLRRRRV
ncbi:MAG: hypothetical protein ACREIT_06855 [Tepidisphaeraceae bacterium]